MGILDLFAGRMSRSDRKAWADATTLADLGELTAQWLQGRIKSQPGYYGPVDVDEDEAPGLTATLIVLNRAGFVTNNSQAGAVTPGYDGAGWLLRAAVTGIADDDTLDRLRAAVRGTRFQILVQDLKRPFRKAQPGVIVTTRAGAAYTQFGGQMDRDDFDLSYGDACGPEAMAAAMGARQVTVYDREWGHNDMWHTLRRMLSDPSA